MPLCYAETLCFTTCAAGRGGHAEPGCNGSTSSASLRLCVEMCAGRSGRLRSGIFAAGNKLRGLGELGARKLGAISSRGSKTAFASGAGMVDFAT